jgi:ADP-dependent NAD(P)H-hydrate dehydratase / NAD(P)H-hydrate epimerase
MKLKVLINFDAIGIGPGWGLEVDLAFYESLLKDLSKTYGD